MNDKNICFIIYVNDEKSYKECVFYIRHLDIPTEFNLEIIAIKDKLSISSGYNYAMKKSNAKYKVYIHQNTLIINKYFIYNILEIFKNNDIGMIGVAGAKNISTSGIWWEVKSERVIKIFNNLSGEMKLLDTCNFSDSYEKVEAISGIIMATQYDIRWRDDIFYENEFYDVAQSLEFYRKRYEVVIPSQKYPWCIYDSQKKVLRSVSEENRIKFLSEYKDEIHPENLVVVRLKGGLGNQMFQYAIARNIKNKTNKKLILDVSFYENYKVWDFNLDIFNLNDDMEINSKYKNIFDSISKKSIEGYIEERDFLEFNKSFLECTNSIIYLDGYFGLYKYFKDIKDILRNEFSVIKNIGIKAKVILDDIKRNNSVCIHFRRGDYVYDENANRMFGVCSLEYYKNAIDKLMSIESNLKFYVFSNDIEWVKDNFKIENCTYVDRLMTTYNFEDFELMKSCKHFIIANSTFSWWSAYLGEYYRKVVIAPKRWYVDEKMNERSSEIIPDGWIRI